MDANQIIIRPILTEKTNISRSELGKYYFEVHKSANKIMVKNAIQNLFNVKVIDCNILNIKGKKIRRVRGASNFKPTVKKAIIQLKSGDHLPFYEGI